MADAPNDRKYLQSHEWHKVEADQVRIGITQFAADELTDITYVKLPAVGDKVEANRPFGEIESVKATSDLVCGVTGTVTEVNEKLAADPGLAKARGAHGIPLLPHAAMSGDVALVSALHAAGATDGASSALVFAVARRHVALVSWLLAHTAPDLAWKNYQGKTALDVARERGFSEIEVLLG